MSEGPYDPAAGSPAPDLSRLPQVDALLRRDDVGALVDRHGRGPVADAIRAVLADVREQVRERGGDVPATDRLVGRTAARLERRADRGLRRVVNATGVVLHTNLGRAPLSAAAREAVSEAAGYTTIEYDLDEGRRGSRLDHLGELAAEACGTESALVVNNGAAALVLVLAALSTGREAVVSRGELIEIGGSYRLPEVMQVSGAVLREVGTTNRTRVEDYEAALSETTGLLLKVHPSNYRIEGFTEAPSAESLATLAHSHGLPFVHDLGSGLLRDQVGPLADEPSVEAAVRAGADLVIFSGDKLLGGPQAGIIAGRGDLLLRCRKHPLARAVRIDKLQRAALEATLASHLRDPTPLDVPTWAMLSTDPAVLRRRAERLADEIGDGATAEPSAALVGGGSLPGVDLPSWCVALAPERPDELATALRRQDPPVVARVEEGRVLLDLRTVPPSQDGELADLVHAARS
jgi:L-seryl-tRNA(Ser) seleniumtransferase